MSFDGSKTSTWHVLDCYDVWPNLPSAYFLPSEDSEDTIPAIHSIRCFSSPRVFHEAFSFSKNCREINWERESVEKTNLLSRSAPLEDLLQLPSLSKNLALKVRVRVFQPGFICPNNIFLILTFPPSPNLQFNFSSGLALPTIYYFCRIWLQFPLLSEWWELWFHPLVLALFFRQRRDMESWADSGPFSHL